MSQIAPLEAFDCEGDTTSVGLRWEKWKKALEIYLTTLNIDKPEKKRATLLHTGGLTLQDIYYNIPGAHVTDNNSGDVYQTAIQKLDEYFSPKQSSVYERHLFRLMKQEPGEKFEKFLVRLRHQSTKCKFADENENLIDQITEKCNSTELRKKILLLGDSVTLDKIISEANAIESVERQLDGFNQNNIHSQSINKLETTQSKFYTKPCTRCGNNKHNSDSISCPAKDKQCLKCGYVGHFRAQCKTRANKRKGSFHDKYKNKKPKVGSREKTETEIDYIFHIDDDAMINCQIGGITVKMLIDSGSKCNIINALELFERT